MQETQETQFSSLGWEDPLEEEMVILQYSCLKNSMDRGTWQATVYWIAKSQTQLSNFILLKVEVTKEEVN